jgi:hypothetical protein
LELPFSGSTCARGVRVRVRERVQCGCACALCVCFRACLRRQQGHGRRSYDLEIWHARAISPDHISRSQCNGLCHVTRVTAEDPRKFPPSSVRPRRFDVILLWRMPWQCMCIVQKQKDFIKNFTLSHARSCPLSSFHPLFLPLCATYAHCSHRRNPTSI